MFPFSEVHADILLSHIKCSGGCFGNVLQDGGLDCAVSHPRKFLSNMVWQYIMQGNLNDRSVKLSR